MLRHAGPILAALLVLGLLLLVRHVRCTGPYRLSRIIPFGLSRRPILVWRERPFIGWCRGWLGFSRFAFGTHEDSVGIIGPPRVGKTAGLLIPQAAMWGGALVSTSTKPDVLRATAARRLELAELHGGSVYVYAPTATGRVEGLQPIRWSPLAGCRDPRVAALRVDTLVTVADVGRNVENADHWRAGAARILRGYFLAAAHHPTQPGDFAVVRRWLSLHEFREPVTILLGLGTAGGQQWADDLIGIAERTNDKERSSFFAAAATALKATALPTVLESCSATDLDPAEFIRTRSTLYIVSASEHQAAVAPLISALIESLVVTAYHLHEAHPPTRNGWLETLTAAVARARRQPAAATTEPVRPPRLLLQLDELTNIAPLPSLESIISQGAGQGVLPSWAIQSLAQLRNRYGADAAEAILSATRCKLVFGGLADGPTLDHLSRMVGDHQVATRSYSVDPDGQRRTTRGFEWRPRLTPAEIRGLRPKWALLLYHHHAPFALRAPVAARRWRMRRAFRPVPFVVPTPVLAAPEPAAWSTVRPHVVVHADEAPAAHPTGANGSAAESRS
jgi:type IV secretion system protein VirD4